MTSTISPSVGVLPQQPAPTSTNCATPPPPPPLCTASPVTTTPSTTIGGGTVQAAQGAMAVAPEQLVPVLQELVGALTNLIGALQQQGGAGAAGAAGAPTQGGGAGTDVSPESPAPSGTGAVDPSSVKDMTSTAGLSAASLKGLEVAHAHGIPLVSGKRGGGGGSTSDHPAGNAIDVSTLAIGSPQSTEGTPEMKAYAEHMRQEAKAGRLDVKYIIRDGQIASPRSNWEFRTYTYPGQTREGLEKLKQSDRGEYNRIQHYDHVHVSFD